MPVDSMARCKAWLSAAQRVFFDCDGIIFDSNAFKTVAFEQAVTGYEPSAVAELLAYHRSNGGVSRYEKFRWFFRRHHPEEEVQRRVDDACARFSVSSRREYARCEPVAEALQLIRHLGRARCIVVSGSDQTELRDVFRAAGISDAVLDVLGSPTGKVEHLRRCLAVTRCSPQDTVFIGDGSGDFRACQELGIPFVFLRQMSDWVDAAQVLRGESRVALVDTWADILRAAGIAA